jgi:hypothetical protein
LATAGRKRHRRALPRFRLDQILAWAAAHARRTGGWPTRRSGPVWEAPADTWKAIDAALHQGHRGLPGGSTLSREIRYDRSRRLDWGLGL